MTAWQRKLSSAWFTSPRRCCRLTGQQGSFPQPWTLQVETLSCKTAWAMRLVLMIKTRLIQLTQKLRVRGQMSQIGSIWGLLEPLV